MKKITSFILLFIVVFLVAGGRLEAQIKKGFQPRFSEAVKGNVTLIANNVLSRNKTTSYTGNDGNHDFSNNVFVDIDNDASTFNSSSANLSNPEPTVSCLSIKKAYLYWAAADKEENDPSDEPNWDYNKIKLQLPGSLGYTTITADDVIYRGRDDVGHFVNDPYICFKDITNEVKALATPYGTYQVANVKAKEGSLTSHGGGNTGTSGGWQIVFVYESPTLPAKNISLFDGYAHVTSSVNNFEIGFSGFQTVPTGDVDVDVVIGALEGDRDLSGDRLQIKNTSNNWVDLSYSLRSSSNFFNSRIAKNGSNFIDRNPASTNTLGFDADVFALSNPGNSIIANNQTSATIRLTSNQETYGLFLIGLSVDVWKPDLAPLILSSSTNTSSVEDTVSFSVNIENNGNDNVKDLKIETTIPQEVDLIEPITGLPFGVTYSYNTTTRLLTFNAIDGITDVGDTPYSLSFQVKVKEQCYFLEEMCSDKFQMQLVATYAGEENNSTQTTLSSKSVDSCGIGDNLPNEISINQPDEANWTTTVGSLDRTVSCDDGAALAAAQLLKPEASCDLTITKIPGSFEASTTNCPVIGTYTNTWTFTDSCGRTSGQFTQTITVADTTDPVWVNEPMDMTSVECDPSTNAQAFTDWLASFSGEDGCGTATVTHNSTGLSDLCGGTGSETVTFTLTDECGNDITKEATFTIVDTTDPVWVNEPTDMISEECDPSTNAQAFTDWLASFSGEDGCGTATVTHNSTGLSDLCGGTGSETVTFTLTDECGNDITKEATFTIVDTTDPVWVNEPTDMISEECDPSTNAQAFTDWLASFSGEDGCGTATVTHNSTGLSDLCGGTGSETVTFTLTDECGNDITKEATFTIVDTTDPVWVNEPTDMISEECDPSTNAQAFTDWLASFSGEDGCGTATVTHNSTGLSDLCGGTGSETVTFTLTDECGNDITKEATFTIVDTTDPVWVNEPTDMISEECDPSTNAQAFTDWLASFSGEDGCGTATVTHNSTGLSDLCGGTGSETVTFTLTDECGNDITKEATFTIVDTTDPVWVNEPTDMISVECDPSTNAQAFTDWLASFSGEDGCGTATVTHNSTGLSDLCGGTGSETVTFTLTDECGNDITKEATFTIVDTTDPVWVNEPTDMISVECDPSTNAQAFTDWLASFSGEDGCGTATVTHNSTGLSDLCGGTGSETVTFTLTDECGNDITKEATFTIVDTTDPVWVNEPTDMISEECDPSTNAQAFTDWLASFSGKDGCGTATVTHNSTGLSDLCGGTGSETVTFTLTDECGNDITKEATFTIVDTTDPVWVNEPTDMISEECDPSTNAQAFTDWLASFSGEDGCGTAIVTHNSTGLSDLCGGTGSETVTFTLTDECGNDITKEATFTIVDTTDPTWVNEPTDMISEECDPSTNAQAFTDWLASFSGKDGCGTATVTHNSTGLSDLCGGTGSETVTFTLTDECGNDITKEATFTIVDTTDPVWVNEPTDMISEECDPSTNAQAFTDWLASFSGKDGCGTAIVTHNSTGLSDLCGGTGSETVTFTLTDECGNDITKEATFTIVDTTDPVWVNEPTGMISEECDPSTNAQAFTDWLASFSGEDGCGTAIVTHNSTGLSDLCGGTGSETVTFTLTDECGNDITKEATFTIVDTTDPVWVNEPTDMISEECDPSTNAQAFTDWLASFSGEDGCGTAIVTHNSTGLSDLCGGTGSETVTFTLTDECGNDITKEATFTIVDTTAPIIDETSKNNIDIECGVGDTGVTLQDWLNNNAGATATDSCGNVTWTNNYGDDTSVKCDGSYITVIFTATDDCGNFSTTTAGYLIKDETPPTITQQPSDKVVECDGSGNTTELNDWLASNGGATATDDCSVVSWSNNYTDLTYTCSFTGEVEVIFTAKDACGNTVDTNSAKFIINDTVAPEFVEELPVAEITVSCDNIPVMETLTATDNCDPSVTVIPSEVTSGDDDACGSEYLITRKWTVSDCSGNTTTHIQVITVEDTVAPEFVEELPAEEITVSCDNIPVMETLTATDNCDASVTVIPSEVTSGDDDACGSEYLITRKWTVSDCSGNTTTHIQVITVEDTVAPEFVEELPVAEITVSCDNIPVMETLTATDNCDASVTVIPSEVTSGDDDACGSEYLITRKWTVSDCSGNTTTHIQVITVEDTVVPEFVEELPAAEITVSCDNIPVMETLTATDNCDPSVTVIPSEVTSGDDDACGSEYLITRKWTVSDCSGNTTTHIQVITVENTVAPEFVEELPAAEITVSCDNIPVMETLTATDNCDPSVTVIPSEVTSGDDDACGSEYLITRKWTVSDCSGNTTTHIQVITVEDTVAPEFVEELPAAEITVSCDNIPVMETLTATDNCDPSVTVIPSEVTSGDDDACGSEYLITRKWTVSDCSGNTTTHIQVITVEDTVAPEFVEELPAAEITVSCDNIPVMETLTATDNCDPSVTVIPSEVKSGDDDACGSEYLITRKWTVSDCSGNTTTHIQVITVEDTVAPEFVEELPAAEITVSCDAIPAAVVLTATDNCSSSVTVNYSEEFAGQDDDCVTEYTITRTWTVQDCAGNETSHSQVVTVEDTVAPEFVEELPADVTISCDTIPEAAVLTATDNCSSSVTVNYSEEFAGQDDDCVTEYTITRTWTVQDCAGNETSHSQVVTVEDTVAPEFVEELPADVTISCDTIPEAAVLTATDNCSSSVTVNYSEEFAGQDDDCVTEYTITRTWTVQDCAGNETSHSQVVTVEDTVAPEFVEELPADVTVSCDTIPEAAVLTATDNCSSSVTVNYSEEFAGQDDDCATEYTITRTWTVQDCAGNETSHSQVVTVEDTVAPEFVEELPANVTVSCDTIPEAAVLTVTDNCSSSVTVNYSEEITREEEACASAYSITRIWTAEDCAGNTVSHTQVINVEDTEAPELVSTLEDITVECDNVPEVPTLEFTDNCSANVTQTNFEETSTFDGTDSNYMITRTWTVSDDCGNVAEFTQTITVTVNTSVTEIADSKCIDDGEINLNDYVANPSEEGSWEVTQGNVVLSDDASFDPSGLSLGDYVFTYTEPNNGCLRSIKVTINLNDDCIVLPCGQEDVVISKAVTPNGDSWNEFFEVTGVESCGFIVNVKIFNRWGAQVFESNNYANNWNGVSDGTKFGGAKRLPAGTYYYIVILENSGLKPFTGAIYLGTK